MIALVFTSEQIYIKLGFNEEFVAAKQLYSRYIYNNCCSSKFLVIFSKSTCSSELPSAFIELLIKVMDENRFFQNSEPYMASQPVKTAKKRKGEKG